MEKAGTTETVIRESEFCLLELGSEVSTVCAGCVKDLCPVMIKPQAAYAASLLFVFRLSVVPPVEWSLRHNFSPENVLETVVFNYQMIDLDLS